MRKKLRRSSLLVAYIDAVGGKTEATIRLLICKQTLNNWLYMRSKPRVGGKSRGGMSREHVRSVILELAKVTGLNVQRGLKLTRADMQLLEEVPTEMTYYEAMAQAQWARLVPWYAAHTQEHLLVQPEDGTLEHAALCEAITAVLCELEPRERAVIGMRFGLCGTAAMSLLEVGELFGVTRERIRQIEGRAIRKLQQPQRAKELVNHCTFLEKG